MPDGYVDEWLPGSNPTTIEGRHSIPSIFQETTAVEQTLVHEAVQYAKGGI